MPSLINVKEPEGAAQTCSVKKLFLEISENSQENTCARVSFLIELPAYACNIIKKENPARCFPVNFEKFLRSFFHRTPLLAASKEPLKYYLMITISSAKFY